ncbi:MAG: hypothetical protein EOO01_01060 [Chitinophagaceae bacterium]|nr:MAG: hypothetical protein EOO01_01060 [Chitinophagaceae bacterium]
MNDVLVDTLVKSDAKDFKSINFNDILFLVYTKESETLTYTEQSSHFITRPKVYTDNQVSLIKQLKGPIKFYQSGAVFNPMAVLYGGFWSYERIGDLMPMDYNPRSGK